MRSKVKGINYWIICGNVVFALILIFVYLFNLFHRAENEAMHLTEKIDRELTAQFRINIQIANYLSSKSIFPDPDYPFDKHGVLRTIDGSPFNENYANVLSTLDWVYSVLQNEGVWFRGRIYFYPIDKSFIYFLGSSRELNSYSYTNRSGVGKVLLHEPLDYNERFLSAVAHTNDDITENGLFIIYKDALTNNPVITLGEYVYSLGYSTMPVGGVYTDYSESDLSEISHEASDEKFIQHVNIYLSDGHNTISLTNNDANCQVYCFSRNLLYYRNFHFKVETSLSVFTFYKVKVFIWITFVLFVTLLITLTGLYLVNRLHKKAILDPLCGIKNRHYLNSIDNRVFYSWKYLAILDCNKFKLINDTFGHDAGDLALKRIASEAQLLSDGNNKVEVIRLGGDEFCILFRQNSYSDVDMKMHSMNKSLENFKLDGESVLSVSWGIAKIEPHLSVSQICKNADVALYKMKNENQMDNIIL